MPSNYRFLSIGHFWHFIDLVCLPFVTSRGVMHSVEESSLNTWANDKIINGRYKMDIFEFTVTVFLWKLVLKWLKNINLLRTFRMSWLCWPRLLRKLTLFWQIWHKRKISVRGGFWNRGIHLPLQVLVCNHFGVHLENNFTLATLGCCNRPVIWNVLATPGEINYHFKNLLTWWSINSLVMVI